MGHRATRHRHRRGGRAALESLHAVLHEVHLHRDAVNLVDSVREALELACEHLQIARIVPGALRSRRLGTHLGAHIVKSSDDVVHLRMQPSDGCFDIGQLAAMGLQHAGVVGDLGLQAGDGAGPDIVGQAFRRGRGGRYRRKSSGWMLERARCRFSNGDIVGRGGGAGVLRAVGRSLHLHESARGTCIGRSGIRWIPPLPPLSLAESLFYRITSSKWRVADAGVPPSSTRY